MILPIFLKVASMAKQSLHATTVKTISRFTKIDKTRYKQ